MNNSVRKITEGAMMVALIGLFGLLDRQFAGLLAANLIWLMPLPIVFYSCQYKAQDSLAMIFAGLVVLILFATLQTQAMYLVMSFCGLAYGYGVRKKWSSDKNLLLTVVITILAELMFMVVFASAFGYDLQAEVKEIMKIMNEFAPNLTSQLPLDTGSMVKMMVIVGVMMTGALEAVLIHLCSVLLLKRLRMPLPPMRPLKDWVLPKPIAYGLFFLAVSMMFLPYLHLAEPWISLITAFGLMSAMILLFFGYIGFLVCGTALFGKKMGWIVLICFIFFFAVFLPFLMVFGFLYSTTNLRFNLIHKRQGGRHE